MNIITSTKICKCNNFTDLLITIVNDSKKIMTIKNRKKYDFFSSKTLFRND